MLRCMRILRRTRGGAEISTDLVLRRFPFIRTLLVLVWPAVSCAPVETRHRAWIDIPTDGTRVSVNASVTVMSHAYALDLVEEVMPSVNIHWFHRFHLSMRSE